MYNYSRVSGSVSNRNSCTMTTMTSTTSSTPVTDEVIPNTQVYIQIAIRDRESVTDSMISVYFTCVVLCNHYTAVF